MPKMTVQELILEHLNLYDKYGFNVIPITPPIRGSNWNDGKRPALRDGWMPYMSRMSTQEEHDLWWFSQGPMEYGEPINNIGIVTGSISDIAVLDFDNQEAYNKLIYAAPDFNSTFTVKTGRGYHVYFRPDIHARTSTFKMDGALHHLKQESSYVVAAPSKHINGNHYEIFINAEPRSFRLAGVHNVLEVIGAVAHQHSLKERPVTWAGELMDIVPDGERNTRAAQLCGLLISKFKYDPALIQGLMKAWNHEYCKPPLDEHELNNLVENEYRRYGPQE